MGMRKNTLTQRRTTVLGGHFEVQLEYLVSVSNEMKAAALVPKNQPKGPLQLRKFPLKVKHRVR